MGTIIRVRQADGDISLPLLSPLPAHQLLWVCVWTDGRTSVDGTKRKCARAQCYSPERFTIMVPTFQTPPRTEMNAAGLGNSGSKHFNTHKNRHINIENATRPKKYCSVRFPVDQVLDSCKNIVPRNGPLVEEVGQSIAALLTKFIMVFRRTWITTRTSGTRSFADLTVEAITIYTLHQRHLFRLAISTGSLPISHNDG
ncbi:hypothetical protein CBL_07115 [Carabus blaptoides fortunei]